MQVLRQYVDVKERRLVIELPASFVNHRVELIALTLDDDLPIPAKARRQPIPILSAKGKP